MEVVSGIAMAGVATLLAVVALQVVVTSNVQATPAIASPLVLVVVATLAANHQRRNSTVRHLWDKHIGQLKLKLKRAGAFMVRCIGMPYSVEVAFPSKALSRY